MRRKEERKNMPEKIFSQSAKKQERPKQKIILKFLTGHSDFGEGFEVPEYELTYLDENNNPVKKENILLDALATRLLAESLEPKGLTFSTRFISGHPELGEGYGMPEYEITIKDKDGNIVSQEKEKVDETAFRLLREKYDIEDSPNL